MLTDELQDISAAMIRRYSDRFDSFGCDIKTLGWGSIEQQRHRFSMTLSADIDFRGKDIVDIGCGFGDYYTFLRDKQIDICRYTGLDINPDLIGEAKRLTKDDPRATYCLGNALKGEPGMESHADVGIMLGLLNVHLKDAFDNYRYSHKMIKNAFHMVKKLLIVDFISANTTDTYPKEDFIFYHEPGRMLEYALTLSDDVVLKHNYAPIPQKEFMLFIYRH